ncbi:tRNA (N6-isopentenyl adenosine(37)-C2)-methylthiotransferase MiaB [Marinimicrococcus flavescens]|uniref:tRNA-2-methylthio-N(6)-dimethylallyladenosine synthase n=1 Tax=Marinimicrococcus flavescens TaxID=3031815 RepID=A0AAP3UXN6_9PROT|nr:tRNA (N6-isopentenyl adenosine(37)-C2)-methylthiotransferase MiaB [Marinimicrococcus flavescens]
MTARVSKSLYIKTYGCQMNVYDSDRMAEALAAHGYNRVDTAETADLVILNTCHIREKAAEKVYSELGRLRRLRDRREAEGQSGMLLAVAGCVAQAEGEAMLERAAFVDVVVGPQAYHRLPELLARRAREQGGQIDTDFPVESKFDELPRQVESSPVSAFLTVQEGCDKFCSFCVVPYTRGAEVSRPAAAVLAEARQLVAAGAREITLLGQNVNGYHGDGPDGRTWSLGRLVRALAEVDGLARIRYTTSHPRDMDEELIRAHGEVPQLMPFLHLPVQSGSDSVLEAMNRKYTAADFLRIVEKLRGQRPDMALSSDFIVGFPGESDEDFAATMRLVEQVGFALSFSFKYSPRPGTPGATMRKQVHEDTKSARLATLQATLDAQARAFNEATVGRVLPVLLERAGRHAGQLVGRTPYLQGVHVEGRGHAIGDLVQVRIDACYPHSLSGTVLEPDPGEEIAA